MRNNVVLAFLALAAVPFAAHATEPNAPATQQAAAKLSTADTDIGTLLDNPAAKAILVKHAPEIAGNAQIAMARSMTLKSIQPYAGDVLSDAILAKIDADLQALPGK